MSSRASAQALATADSQLRHSFCRRFIHNLADFSVKPRPAIYLIDWLACPSIMTCPEWALGTGCSLWIVYTFFMGTPYNLISISDRLHAMLGDECHHLLSDHRITPHITLV
jgi:hypothetical protein